MVWSAVTRQPPSCVWSMMCLPRHPACRWTSAYNGHKFHQLILDLLIQFRSYKVALIANVEKAFFKIAVDEKDSNVLRLIWVDDVAKEEPELRVYRFTRVMFGVSLYSIRLWSTTWSGSWLKWGYSETEGLTYSNLATEPTPESTYVYIPQAWFYFTPLESPLHFNSYTYLYLTLLPSPITLLHSTWLYIILPWSYFTLLDTTLLYHGFTSLYLTLLPSTIALLESASV